MFRVTKCVGASDGSTSSSVNSIKLLLILNLFGNFYKDLFHSKYRRYLLGRDKQLWPFAKYQFWNFPGAKTFLLSPRLSTPGLARMIVKRSKSESQKNYEKMF